MWNKGVVHVGYCTCSLCASLWSWLSPVNASAKMLWTCVLIMLGLLSLLAIWNAKLLSRETWFRIVLCKYEMRSGSLLASV